MRAGTSPFVRNESTSIYRSVDNTRDCHFLQPQRCRLSKSPFRCNTVSIESRTMMKWSIPRIHLGRYVTYSMSPLPLNHHPWATRCRIDVYNLLCEEPPLMKKYLCFFCLYLQLTVAFNTGIHSLGNSWQSHVAAQRQDDMCMHRLFRLRDLPGTLTYLSQQSKANLLFTRSIDYKGSQI